MSTGRKSYY